MRRLRLVKESKLYQSARKVKSNKKERQKANAFANAACGYDEYSLHAFATIIRRSWIGEHIDSNTAQKARNSRVQCVPKSRQGHRFEG
jgi:hypothetical protein